MRRSDVPCADCEERTPKCHAECERYAEFRKTLSADWNKRVADEIGRKKLDRYEVDSMRRRGTLK